MRLASDGWSERIWGGAPGEACAMRFQKASAALPLRFFESGVIICRLGEPSIPELTQEKLATCKQSRYSGYLYVRRANRYLDRGLRIDGLCGSVDKRLVNNRRTCQ